MAYVTPGTVAAGDVATAAAWNVLTNDVINLRALANVQSTTITTSPTTVSGSMADVTGLTVTITPTTNTSKILVSGMITVGSSSGADVKFQLVQVIGASSTTLNGTSAYVVAFSGYAAAPNLTYVTANGSFEHLDSPATTSAVTYKLQWQTTSATAYLNRRGYDTANNSFSSITVREIPA